MMMMIFFLVFRNLIQLRFAFGNKAPRTTIHTLLSSILKGPLELQLEQGPDGFSSAPWP